MVKDADWMYGFSWMPAASLSGLFVISRESQMKNASRIWILMKWDIFILVRSSYRNYKTYKYYIFVSGSLCLFDFRWKTKKETNETMQYKCYECELLRLLTDRSFQRFNRTKVQFRYQRIRSIIDLGHWWSNFKI